MAKLMVIGAMAQIEITQDEDEECYVGTCVQHSEYDGRLTPPGNCDWSERYDSLNDATEYVTDHADTGRDIRP